MRYRETGGRSTPASESRRDELRAGTERDDNSAVLDGTGGRPSLARGPDAGAILDHLAELSAPFGTPIHRDGDRTTIHPT